MNYFAAISAVIILILLWIGFHESGCWAIGSRSQGSVIILCGFSGLMVGITFSAIVIFAVFKWLIKK